MGRKTKNVGGEKVANHGLRAGDSEPDKVALSPIHYPPLCTSPPPTGTISAPGHVATCETSNKS
jgi:hypothetical protein